MPRLTATLLALALCLAAMGVPVHEHFCRYRPAAVAAGQGHCSPAAEERGAGCCASKRGPVAPGPEAEDDCCDDRLTFESADLDALFGALPDLEPVAPTLLARRPHAAPAPWAEAEAPARARTRGPPPEPPVFALSGARRRAQLQVYRC